MKISIIDQYDRFNGQSEKFDTTRGTLKELAVSTWNNGSDDLLFLAFTLDQFGWFKNKEKILCLPIDMIVQLTYRSKTCNRSLKCGDEEFYNSVYRFVQMAKKEGITFRDFRRDKDATRNLF